jgi:uncharacterized membrane protein
MIWVAVAFFVGAFFGMCVMALFIGARDDKNRIN